MNLLDFNPEDYARGAKYRTMQSVTSELEIPLLIARGAQPGPTLVVSANVHGDEYEGVRAIFEVFDRIDPGEMLGDLFAVPVMNPPAFWNCSRNSPLDGRNLARVFPGDPNGSVSERLACSFAHSVLARASFYLDLHSGGVAFRMPSMAGYPSGDERARAAAEIFGAEVIWGHPTLAAGRTVSFASDRGIPWLYTEARGAGRIAPEDLQMMKRGIFNLLRHLRILPGEPDVVPVRRRLHGDGDTDRGVVATQDGFLMIDVKILDTVQSGRRLGYLVNLKGEVLERYHAGCDGVVALVRELPVVRAGEVLFLLAEEQS